jgi:hypothetical protein
MPWLRSNGYKIKMIESDIVKQKRWYSIPKKTTNYLKNRVYKDANVCEYYKDIGNINLKQNGNTKDLILDNIHQSQMDGYFTFNEMMLYAKRALTQYNTLPIAIQQRFPIVFIDEAQDTNAEQWDLINIVFPKSLEHIVKQCYGDVNQAIYSNFSDDTVNDINISSGNCLVLNNSKRFDGRIAKLADTVSVRKLSVNMSGTNNEFSSRGVLHTVFLFQNNKTQQVIDEFGQLVLDTFSDDEIEKNKNYGCHIIGMVHNKNDADDNGKNFPKGVYDYWGEYDSNKSINQPKSKSMIDYFRIGQTLYAETGELGKAVEWYSKGIVRLMNMLDGNYNISYNSNSFRSMLSLLSEGNKIIFRNKFLALLNEGIPIKSNWPIIKDEIKDILKIFNFIISDENESFIKWHDDAKSSIANIGLKDKTLSNHYLYKSNDRSVDLEFGSIHSVKGRTHLATLVVETYWYDHNMKSIMKFLCCKGTYPTKTDKNRKRLRCQYVAMTRAKGLLCLAVPFEFVSEIERNKLRELGWNIKIVK